MYSIGSFEPYARAQIAATLLRENMNDRQKILETSLIRFETSSVSDPFTNGVSGSPSAWNPVLSGVSGW